MNNLPNVLIEYISGFSDLLSLVRINKSYIKRFSDRCRRLKQKNIMSKKIIDTFLIEMKKRQFKQSNFNYFDFYLFHHVTNLQQIISLRKWWLKKYPNLNSKVFEDNIIRILGNTYQKTEKVLTEYIVTC